MSFLIYSHRFGIENMVQPAAQAARTNPAANPVVQMFDYVMDKITEWFNKDETPDPGWLMDGECRHRDPCHCLDVIVAQNQALTIQVDELSRDLYKYRRYHEICERQHGEKIVKGAPWGFDFLDDNLPLSPRLEPCKTELQGAKREIAVLIQERDSARRVAASHERKMEDIQTTAQRQVAELTAKINKLQNEVNWAQGAGEGYKRVQVELEEKKAEIEKLKKQVRELSDAGSALRGELAFTKENTVNKCQNEAGCQMQIREMKTKYEQVMNTHREMELQVRDAAILLGESPHYAQHMNLSSYINQVTLVLLEFKRLRAIGAPGANTADLQNVLRDKEYIKQQAHIGRLERELEHLGGDVLQIRAGLDTRKPHDFRTVKLTYEQNTERVHEVYLEVYTVVQDLTKLLNEHSITLPKLTREIFRDCESTVDWGMELTWIEFSNVQCNPCYASIEELSEHLVRAEVERWYDRGMELLRQLCRQPGFDDEMTKKTGLKPGVTYPGILYPYKRVLNHCLDVVLDDIRPLVISDTDTKPNSLHRKARKFKIYQSMQEAIYGLTKAIINDKRGPLIPQWKDPDPTLQPPLPSPPDTAIMEPEKLSSALIMREMLILERRINQLLRFMDSHHLPGTLTGGPFEHRQGNPEYEKNWRSCVAIRAWSSLVLSHWHLFLSQKPVQVPDLAQPKGYRLEYEPDDHLLPLDQEKFVQSAGLIDEFKKLGWREQIRRGQWPDNVKEPQLQYSAVIGPWLRWMKPHRHRSSMNPFNPNAYSSSDDESNDYPNKPQTAEYLALDLELKQNKARIDQLKNFINVWGIRHDLVMPNTDVPVRKNAKIETIRKALIRYKAWVLDLERHINKHKKNNQFLPAWPKDGGAMNPAWGN
jgi:hypothetical protein